MSKKANKMEFPKWLIISIFLLGFLFGLYCINSYFEHKRDFENACDVNIKLQTADCNAKNTAR